jgi:hypothetical protein
MNLKSRLKNLETIAAPQFDYPTCIYLVGAYPKGQIKPPVIGYAHNGVKYMRLENESDDDLQARVNASATRLQANRRNNW